MSTVLKPPPVICPPFTLESAIRKVRAAEDAWNSRDPDRVVLGYTEDSHRASNSPGVLRPALVPDDPE
jgi:nuclear transport factor 2 (NTF2) superfamily protein